MREQLGEAARWGDTEHLLADLIDLAQGQMWQFASANSKKRPKRPKPIRRPGIEPAGEKRMGTARMTVAEARAYMDRFGPPK